MSTPMNFLAAARAAKNGHVIIRNGGSIPFIYSPDTACLVYDMPGPLSSRKFTPSMEDILAEDWEFVG